MFYISYASPRITDFPKNLSSLYWRMATETKIWVEGVLIAPRVLLLSGPLPWQPPFNITPDLSHIFGYQSGHWKHLSVLPQDLDYLQSSFQG